MIAAKFGDPVLGVDVHQVLVPAPPSPVPVPTPLPHPFIGVVFDPIGAAVGAAIGLALGGGGPVLVNGLPCGNTGTAVKGSPHVPTPPGVSFSPADIPGNEGTLVTGSKTVHFGGNSESRTGSMVMSCGFPVNLPSSVCLAVPAGAPVLIGGPEALDFQAAATSMIRTKWISDKLHGILNAKPGSWRSKIICFFTGHPVDVMTGELIADAVDFELAGPIPVRWERNYRSRQVHPGALGPGWTHAFDEMVEERETELLLRLADGRPKKHKVLGLGESEWDGEDCYRLTRLGSAMGYERRTAEGLSYRYSHSPEPRLFMLTEVRDRSGNRIELRYDRQYLVSVRDSAGRLLEIAWTRKGRVEGVYLCAPARAASASAAQPRSPYGAPSEQGPPSRLPVAPASGRGAPPPSVSEKRPLVRYQYDLDGRLAAAIDPPGHALRYEYDSGVMVKETHKGGLSFHFEWDWMHPEGWCVRTWGEDPNADGKTMPRFVYDRRIIYDPTKHYTRVDDGRGGITQYWGNALGLVEKVMSPMGVVTEYAWSQDCRKLSETDGLGQKTEWRYDEWGNLVEERKPTGAITRRAYDAQHELVEEVDPAGQQWRIERDPRGLPLRVWNPKGAATTYVYDEHGQLLGVDDPMGRRLRYGWTAERTLEWLTDGNDQKTSFAHDAMGKLVRVEDATGRVSLARREAMGRIEYLEEPSGEKLWLRRDAEGSVIEQTDSQGRRTRFRYAGLGKLVEHTDPMNFSVRLHYDTDEELTGVTNQAGERYRFYLDKAGRVDAEVGFDGRKQRYYYDKAGRTNRIVGPGYKVVVLQRDAEGRVVERKLPDGVEHYAYDLLGNLIEAATPDAALELKRDALGQIVKERTAVGNTKHAIGARYDHSGFRVERETSLGHRTEYQWDNAGELVGMKAGYANWLHRSPLGRALEPLRAGDWEMSISRNAIGLEVARRLPGGVEAHWQRDVYGRPTERHVLVTARGSRIGKDVISAGYHWKSPDQIGAIIDTERGPTRHDYDPRGNLVRSILPDGTTVHRATDPLSNVYRTPTGKDREYGTGGVLRRIGSTEYKWDEDGNLVEKKLADGATWKYQWSASGNLKLVARPDGKVVRFVYDALGRRVRKDFNGKLTEYIWDGDELVHERTTNADGSHIPLVTWLFEPGTFTPAAKLEGRKRFGVVSDHLGTPTILTTEAGRIAWRAQLDIWGVAHIGDPEARDQDRTECPWRWPGQYEDEETGLYYNRFRYYDPDMGRYISPDPIGLRGGLGQYAYVHDPLGWVDPRGLAGCKTPGEATEGIYEFTGQSGRKYVGQSGDVSRRLAEHLRSGKLPAGGTVRVTEVLGGKTAREVAEQKTIDALGGVDRLENKINPIGPKRKYLLGGSG